MSDTNANENDKERPLKVFVDAQGIFRQMRHVDDLLTNAGLQEMVAKVNLMAREAEEAGMFPPGFLARVSTDGSIAELTEVMGRNRQAFIARFPDHRLG